MFKKIILPGIIFITLFFINSGCSSAPPSREDLIRQAMKVKLPANPTGDSAVVYIIRPGSIGEKYKYDVFVNDPKNKNNRVGYNMGNEYIYFRLSPGKYRIYSHADNGAWIDIKAEQGKIYFIEQTATAGLVRGNNSLKFLDVYSGRLLIGKLKAGRIIRQEY